MKNMTKEMLNPDQLGYKGLTNQDRFWKKVDKKDIDDCWEWLGSHRSRYGSFKLTKGLSVIPSRYSYFLFTGVYPDVYVCHTCDNIFCVNPRHLFLGTQTINMQDMWKKGRGPNRIGLSNGNHVLSEDDVLAIRKLRLAGKSRKEILSIFPIKNSQYARILNGETWTHLIQGSVL